MVTVIPPKLQAILLCDELYVDAATQKKLIIGVFNQLSLGHVPANRGKMTKGYLSLTSVHGTVPVVLRWVELAANSILLESSVDLQGDDPNQPVELLFEIPALPVHRYGWHALEVHVGHELLHIYRVNVVSSSPQDASDDEKGQTR
jgi:hypothetical protein